MQKFFGKLVGIFILLNIFLVSFGVQPAQAAGIVVNSNADTIADDGFCTLREAVTAANTDAEVSGCPAGSGDDAITFAGNYTITLGSQLPAVTTTIAIYGTGLTNTIIQANAAFNTATYRIFRVASNGSLSLDALTIQNGRCNVSCELITNSGGGILNTGDLTITNSKVANSSATDGGGIMTTGSNSSLSVTNSIFSGDPAVISGYGGAISNGGSELIVYNSTFSNNFSSIRGGAIANSGPLSNINTITNSTFSGNSSVDGGAIFNDATLTITNSTFSGNSSSNPFSGAVHNQALSTLNLYNTIIANSGSNRDCYNASGTINASNNLMENAGTTYTCGLSNDVDGNIIGSDPALGPLADNGGPTQTHALLTSSPAPNEGTNTVCPNTDQRGVPRPQTLVCDIGAVESNTQQNTTLVVNTNEDSNDGFCDAFVSGVTDCTLREAINYANGVAGTWTITFAANYTITLNDQLATIGTIIINGNGANNTIIQANALPNTANRRVFQVNSGSTLTLNQVTVRHGVCEGGCATNGGIGGGIHVMSSGTLFINNSLISANNSVDGGAGLYNGLGNVTITNSTFSDNTTSNAGGAITNQGTMTVSNSTVTNNTATGSNYAGGIRNVGTLNIYNSTISGNTSSSLPTDGANIVQDSGTLNLYNTIIANAITGGDCAINAGTVNATNTLIESSGSLACNNLANGSNGNIIGSDPNLGPLTGSPAYFPLNTGSPAIDAGSNAICAAAPVNNRSQNGTTRPKGSACEIGSFEKSSAIPTSATFDNVPTTHPYFADIEILYANGYTAGCSTSAPLLFCPETTMNRAQSAVFMVRGNFGTSYSPPAAPWTTFGDDFSPGTWAQPWAQGMFDAGLTAGCSTNPRLFCPWEEMPRFQAAVFGMRLREGINYPPPAGTGSVFADIDGSEWYAGWVEQAYLNGLLPACGSSGGTPLFCPNDLVPRGLAAYMIVRAKNLTMP